MVKISVSGNIPNEIDQLKGFFNIVSRESGDFHVHFSDENDTLTRQDRASISPGFTSPIFLNRLNSMGKKQPLLKAIGIEKPIQSVLDISMGWGVDAFTMAYFGLQVTAIERNPLVFLLVERALARLEEFENLSEAAKRMNLVSGDSREFLKNCGKKHDVVFYDPMFPSEFKSGVSKKEMAFLEELDCIGGGGEEKIINFASQNAQKRVVVKRSKHAPQIHPNVSHSIESKLLRYDVYLTVS